QLAMQQQRQPDGSVSPAMEEMFLTARYNLSVCRREYGKALSGSLDNPKKTEAFEAARAEIRGLAVTGLINDERWDDFDQLYQQVQRDLGSAVPEPLPKPTEIQFVSTAPVAPPSGDVEDYQPQTAAEEGPATVPPPETNWLLVVIGVVVALAVTAGIAWLLMKPPKRQRMVYATKFVGPPPAPAGASGPPRKKVRPAASASSKPVKPAGGTQAAPQAKQTQPRRPRPPSAPPKP
ncbi:MAG: hypothetical protein ACREIV_11610, partial [Planctomycetaceae bacterium]